MEGKVMLEKNEYRNKIRSTYPFFKEVMRNKVLICGLQVIPQYTPDTYVVFYQLVFVPLVKCNMENWSRPLQKQFNLVINYKCQPTGSAALLTVANIFLLCLKYWGPSQNVERNFNNQSALFK